MHLSLLLINNTVEYCVKKTFEDIRLYIAPRNVIAILSLCTIFTCSSHLVTDVLCNVITPPYFALFALNCITDFFLKVAMLLFAMKRHPPNIAN